MNNPKHLPPEALTEWLEAAAAELGIDPAQISIATLLDVARDVAHDVARPAAPLSTFLLGIAVGRAQDSGAALEEYSKALSELARRWEAPAI